MDNNQLALYGAIGAGVLLLFIVTVVSRGAKRRNSAIDPAYYAEKWHIIERQAGKKESWPLAIINADKLLDGVLKKRGFKGKTMGERLVAAQRDIKRNDAVWFAHKLRNRLVHDEEAGLREKDVKAAILGFQQAMKDLGALR